MYPANLELEPLPSINLFMKDASKDHDLYYHHDPYQHSSSFNGFQAPVYTTPTQWSPYPYPYQTQEPNHFNITPPTNEHHPSSSAQHSETKNGMKGLRRPRADGVCSHCSTTTTTLWRKNEHGILECNACNLYYRRNGVKRPLNLVKEKPATRNRKHPKKLAKK